MKKNFLILFLAMAGCFLPMPIIANRLGADQEAMSIFFWITPCIIISQTMSITKKMTILQILIASAVACLLTSFLGVIGFVLLPIVFLGSSLLGEPPAFWILHFVVMNAICLFTMWFRVPFKNCPKFRHNSG